MIQALSWGLDAILVIIAFVLGVFIYKWISERKVGDASERARQILTAAERDAESQRRAADVSAKELALKAREEFETEIRRREREIQQIEQRVQVKDEQLGRKLEESDRRLTANAAKEKALVERETALGQKETRVAQAFEEQRRKLEVIAGLTAEEAKR